MSGIDLSFLDEAFHNIPIEELFDFVRSYKFEVNVTEAENCLFEEFLRKNDPDLIVDADILNSSSFVIPKSADFFEKFVEEKIENGMKLDSKDILETEDEDVEEIEENENNYLDKVSQDPTTQNDSEYEYETTVKVTTIPRISEKNVNPKSHHSSRFIHPRMSQMLRPSLFSTDLMSLEQESFNEDYLEDISADQVDDFEEKIVKMRTEHIKSMNHFQVELFEIELSIKELKNAKLGMDLCVNSEKSFFVYLNNLSQKCSNLLEKYRLGNSKFKADLKEIQKRVRRNEEMSGVLMPVDYVLLNIEVHKNEVLENEKSNACYVHRFDEYNNKKKVVAKKSKILDTKSKIQDHWLEVKEHQKIINNQKIESQKTERKIKNLQEKLDIKTYKLSKYSAPSAFQYILLSDTLRETDINLEKQKRLNQILKIKITNAKAKCKRMRSY